MSKPTNAAIEVNSLSKSYGDSLILDSLTFTVSAGEVFGFLGPNGAGKTTAIRIINGLSKSSSGYVTIFGHDTISEIKDVKRLIGVVPDTSNLYDELTILENINFIADLFDLDREFTKNNTEKLLRGFNLYERRNSLFGELSRGMRRAVTIVAALIHNPKILFLDEPTTGLDALSSRNLRKVLLDLKAQGITIFLTTHDLDEADLLCDRVALIVKGKLVKTDTTENLKSLVSQHSVVEIEFVNPLTIEAFIKSTEKEVSVELKNNKLRLVDCSPEKAAFLIAKYIPPEKVKIKSINTIRPTLEDAFIELTGLSKEDLSAELRK